VTPSEIVQIGLSISLQPENLAFAFIGAVIGTLVGVLPGLGPAAALALLLPVSFGMSPVGAIIMLAGIYYGAQYGGSTTSILVNIPGEASSIVTCLDGYQMARRGDAGPALAIAAIGSFVAGTVGTLGLMLLAPPLVQFALSFGPPEYVALIFLGFVTLTFMAQGSMLKALMMTAAGLVLSTVGLDHVSGVARFTFGITEMLDGVDLVPAVMGLFGVSEVLINLEAGLQRREIFAQKIRGVLPSRAELRRSAMPVARGTLLGFFLGILPGGGAILSSFISYAVEKRVSKHPERFGTGMIEGVAGPEAANNAGASGAFIPLLTLGLPTNAVVAILLGALMIHGVEPGPLVMRAHPEIFWGVIFSMYVGNVMLLVLNLPLIGLWVRLLRVPYPVLFPLILLFCLIGAYSIANSTSNIFMMLGMGVVGYWMRKTGYEPAPLVVALVLGGPFETALRQSLILSAGSFAIFFTRPIALVLMVAAFALLALAVASGTRARMQAQGLVDAGT
jgi:putative tricarboxylic transport membrane protein